VLIYTEHTFLFQYEIVRNVIKLSCFGYQEIVFLAL
jgi:hypothetical protein